MSEEDDKRPDEAFEGAAADAVQDESEAVSHARDSADGQGASEQAASPPLDGNAPAQGDGGHDGDARVSAAPFEQPGADPDTEAPVAGSLASNDVDDGDAPAAQPHDEPASDDGELDGLTIDVEEAEVDSEPVQQAAGVDEDEVEMFSDPADIEDDVAEDYLEMFGPKPGTPPVPAAPPGGPLPVLDDEERPSAPPRPLRVIVISGSRGGVGKTMLATNLALYLATIGRRVVLVDADPAGASVHTGLGVRLPAPMNRLRRAARPDGPPVPEEALVATSYQGLRLLYAGVDEPAAAGSRGDRLTKLMTRLRTIDAEYVIVDLGVGLSREVLDAYLDADLGLYVTVPEPTAIENTYRFVRGAFVRYLLSCELDEEERGELERRLKALNGAPPPLDLLEELEREHHPLADKVRAAMQSFHPLVAINQTRLRADLQLGFAMESAARRKLGVRIEYVGHVDHDDTVWTCVRNRRPVLLDVPGAKSSKKIEKLARRLLVIESGKRERVRLPAVPQHSHHDMLELDRGATDEEVRRAYKRCREVYAHEALCCYGLFEPNEIEKMRARIDEAFDVLLDPARRRPYELSVFPDEPEPDPTAGADEEDLEPPRPMPSIDPDTQFTGALLRDVREAKRISLREISQRTKVGIAYLKAIESEDYGKLPAVVYTRGFVSELARYLKLDARQASRTYVQRYQQYLDNKQRNMLRGRS